MRTKSAMGSGQGCDSARDRRSGRSLGVFLVERERSLPGVLEDAPLRTLCVGRAPICRLCEAVRIAPLRPAVARVAECRLPAHAPPILA